MLSLVRLVCAGYWHWWISLTVNQYTSTGSGNGWALNRQQVITCTDADLVRWRIYASLLNMESFVTLRDYMNFHYKDNDNDNDNENNFIAM